MAARYGIAIAASSYAAQLAAARCVSGFDCRAGAAPAAVMEEGNSQQTPWFKSTPAEQRDQASRCHIWQKQGTCRSGELCAGTASAPADQRATLLRPARGAECVVGEVLARVSARCVTFCSREPAMQLSDNLPRSLQLRGCRVSSAPSSPDSGGGAQWTLSPSKPGKAWWKRCGTAPAERLVMLVCATGGAAAAPG